MYSKLLVVSDALIIYVTDIRFSTYMLFYKYDIFIYIWSHFTISVIFPTTTAFCHSYITVIIIKFLRKLFER